MGGRRAIRILSGIIVVAVILGGLLFLFQTRAQRSATPRPSNVVRVLPRDIPRGLHRRHPGRLIGLRRALAETFITPSTSLNAHASAQSGGEGTGTVYASTLMMHAPLNTTHAPLNTTHAPVKGYGGPSTAPAYDPTAPSASIMIPRLGVRAPVYDRGTLAGEAQPEIAPGYTVTHYRFSASLGSRGNYVIYGHDDIQGNIFQSLPTMRVGDLVYMRRGQTRFVYRVTGGGIVDPSDVAVMGPTTMPTLTMISCTPLYVDSQRIVVRAALVAR